MLEPTLLLIMFSSDSIAICVYKLLWVILKWARCVECVRKERCGVCESLGFFAMLL